MGAVFPAYTPEGDPVDVTLKEAAAVYIPDGYPNTDHPNLGFVLAAHGVDKVDTGTAATIARYFGMPVLYHGEYPNWVQAGYTARSDINEASGKHLARVNRCIPADYIRGYFPLALAKTDLRAITLLQRLAEQAGGDVQKVALRGFSKEGKAAWLAFMVDDRIEVGIPGGSPTGDAQAWGQFMIKAYGCAEGSELQSKIQSVADGQVWRSVSPAGAALKELYGVVENLDLMHPRVFLIDGDVGMWNMHDGIYDAGTGSDSAFLDGLTSRPWRFVRKATSEQGADGEDGDLTSTTAVPMLGAELLASGAGSEATIFPNITSDSATMSGDSFVASATTSAAATAARVWWTWSTDRVFDDRTQAPWTSVAMTASGAGTWTSPSIAVPAGTVIAWYAEAGNSVTVGGKPYVRNHAAPIRILRPTADLACTPTPASCE